MPAYRTERDAWSVRQLENKGMDDKIFGAHTELIASSAPMFRCREVGFYNFTLSFLTEFHGSKQTNIFYPTFTKRRYSENSLAAYFHHLYI